MEVCKFEGCEKESASNGYCRTHLNHYYNFGGKIGIYKLNIEDHYYIGKAVFQSITNEVNKHKYEMINKTSNKKLVEFFNGLCEKNLQISRNEVYDKFVKVEILEESVLVRKIVDDGKTITFSDKSEDIRDGFEARFSGNDELKYVFDITDKYWTIIEHRYIEKYKELDKTNCTDHCLNER